MKLPHVKILIVLSFVLIQVAVFASNYLPQDESDIKKNGFTETVVLENGWNSVMISLDKEIINTSKDSEVFIANIEKAINKKAVNGTSCFREIRSIWKVDSFTQKIIGVSRAERVPLQNLLRNVFYGAFLVEVVGNGCSFTITLPNNDFITELKSGINLVPIIQDDRDTENFAKFRDELKSIHTLDFGVTNKTNSSYPWRSWTPVKYKTLSNLDPSKAYLIKASADTRFSTAKCEYKSTCVNRTAAEACDLITTEFGCEGKNISCECICGNRPVSDVGVVYSEGTDSSNDWLFKGDLFEATQVCSYKCDEFHHKISGGIGCEVNICTAPAPDPLGNGQISTAIPEKESENDTVFPWEYIAEATYNAAACTWTCNESLHFINTAANTCECNEVEGWFLAPDGTCLSCADGQYYDPTTKSCIACEAGNACSGGLKTACMGTTWSDASAVSCNDTCPAGSSCSGGIKTTCTGTTWSDADAPTCSTCPAGSSCSGGLKTACTGTDWSDADAPTCSTCPAGSSCSGGLKTACTGTDWSDEGALSCSSCPAGSSCASGIKTACTPGTNWSVAEASSCSDLNICPPDNACGTGLPVSCSMTYHQSLDKKTCDPNFRPCESTPPEGAASSLEFWEENQYRCKAVYCNTDLGYKFNPVDGLCVNAGYTQFGTASTFGPGYEECPENKETAQCTVGQTCQVTTTHFATSDYALHVCNNGVNAEIDCSILTRLIGNIEVGHREWRNVEGTWEMSSCIATECKNGYDLDSVSGTCNSINLVNTIHTVDECLVDGTVVDGSGNEITEGHAYDGTEFCKFSGASCPTDDTDSDKNWTQYNNFNALTGCEDFCQDEPVCGHNAKIISEPARTFQDIVPVTCRVVCQRDMASFIMPKDCQNFSSPETQAITEIGCY